MAVIQLLLGVLIVVVVVAAVQARGAAIAVRLDLRRLQESLIGEIRDFYLPRETGLKKAIRSAEASVSQVLAHGGEAQDLAELEAEQEYLSRWGIRVPDSRFRSGLGTDS